MLQTAGNHFVSLVHNNKFAQGSLFTSTDGAWAIGRSHQGHGVPAQLREVPHPTRCTVQLLPLELNGGICAIDLNFDSTRPPGTTINFEVQHEGVWMPLGYYDSNPLVQQPPLLPFRVLLVGTTDEMPGIGVAAELRVADVAAAHDFRHISTVRTMPNPVNTVYRGLQARCMAMARTTSVMSTIASRQRC